MSAAILQSSDASEFQRTHNRRRSERVPKVLDAWICSPTATNVMEEREEVTAVNLSRHGVGFQLDHEVPTGAFYVIQIGMGAQEVVSEAVRGGCGILLIRLNLCSQQALANDFGRRWQAMGRMRRCQ
jgi:hypothetical protein